jgi:hypothetical protein
VIFNGSVRQATIGTVDPGTVFAADLGQNDITYCMAIEPAERESVPSFIAILPGHPMLRGLPGVLNGSVISSQKILVYPTATIVPSPNPEHLRFSSYRSPNAGSLSVFDDGLAIVAATGHSSVAAYSCSDGSARRAYDAQIHFRSWEIMIEGPGGEPHTLCVVRLPDE